MRVVDLTRPLQPGFPVFPGDPAVQSQLARTHENDGYQVTQICLGSHSGTHIDAPRHLFPQGATLDRYPVERFLGPGVVINCRISRERYSPDVGRDGRIIDAQLLAERLTLWPVPPGGFALLWTEGALLSLEAAHLLVDARPLLVGTDAPSLDEEPFPVHRLLLGNNILLAENLCGLDELGPGPVTCAFLPLNLPDADGAPVRAIAWR